MQQIWTRIKTWLQSNAPQALELLQSGALDLQIDRLEEFLAIKLPEDVKASYRICNGQSEYKFGLINGREFLSLESIKGEWKIWKELFDSGTFQNEAGEDCGSDREIGIRNVW